MNWEQWNNAKIAGCALCEQAGGELIWVGTQNHYNTFVTHTYRADNRTLNDSWQAIHKVVNGANHIIAKVPLLNETGLTDQQRNQLLGEEIGRAHV